MLSRKKIAVVSGLLGGLAVACAGVTQVYAAAGGTCTNDKHGSVTCVNRVVGSTPEGDAYIVRQSEGCVPTQPLTLPVAGLLNRGNMQIGPQVTCSPNNPAPERGEEGGLNPLGLLS
ncbi:MULTISPECIES: hypothetical protein [unclassified Streptomyces]|uniref:hypothetical protein n=1 Tax=unclassified Streptomyces TaxID=2593676 RepID=UPI00382AB3F8